MVWSLFDRILLAKPKVADFLLKELDRKQNNLAVPITCLYQKMENEHKTKSSLVAADRDLDSSI